MILARSSHVLKQILNFISSILNFIFALNIVMFTYTVIQKMLYHSMCINMFIDIQRCLDSAFVVLAWWYTAIKHAPALAVVDRCAILPAN